MTIETGTKPLGSYSKAISLKNIGNGVYYLIYKNGSLIDIKKFALIKN
jgi:hypothetical protein